MKKLCLVFSLFVVALLAACGGANTPSDVAKDAIKKLQKGDYEGYVDLLYVKPGDEEQVEKQKDMLVSMLKEKGEQSLGAKEGIAAYEVVSETLSESGERAKVVMKIEFGNGDSQEETMKLRKDEDGDWKLDGIK